MTIETLIDKQDTFEVVRAKIESILVTEVAAQKVLADDDGQDSRLWDLRVFDERARPWTEFLEAAHKRDAQIDVSPIVSVRFDDLSLQPNASELIERQTYEGRFLIDCYGYGLSDAGVAGDRKAALEAQRAAKLVRNILMAAHYTYLDMRGVVGRRSIVSVRSMQGDEDNGINVAAVQLVLVARFVETSPQHVLEAIAGVDVDVERLDTGEVILSASWDATP